MKKKLLLLLFCFILLLSSADVYAGAVDRHSTPLNIVDGPASVPELIVDYYEDKKDLNLVYIFPHNPEYFSRYTRFYADWLSRLKAVDFKSLSVSDRVDFLLLKRNIQSDRDRLQQAQEDYEKYNYAIPFSKNIISLQQQRRRGDKLDGMETAKICSEIQRQIERAKELVLKNPLPNKRMLNEARRAVDELRRGLKSVYDFYNGYDPVLDWWLKTIYPNTNSDLQSYSKWLAAQPVLQMDKAMDSSGIIGHPIGEKQIEASLKKEFIPYSPQELIDIATEEFAWCDSQMLQASREMGFGNDWKAALEKVKENYVKPGYQPQLVNKLEEKALAFIDSLNLITVPPLAREAWRMDMLTTEQQKFASYFLGGSEILVAYPTDQMTYDERTMSLRSNNYAFSNAVVYHELIPGHNLQFFIGRRHKRYRKVFSTPFSIEGWAFYWEMLMWDKGYDRTPEERVGALFWRMTRCARVIFSLNYHLGKWTPQQCIDYLVDRVGLERASAESEVRRSFTGGYGPLYQLAYMFGALQLHELHHELVDGGKLTDKEFHDAYLQENTIPIELFRAILIHQKLPEDFVTKWRFYKK